MPGADVEAVVTLALCAGCRAKILEVASSSLIGNIAACPATGEIFMVTHGRMGDGFDTPPTKVIRLLEGLVSTAVILVISQVKHRGQAGIYQQIGGV